MEPISTIAATSPLWLPGLTWLIGRTSASRPGRYIEDVLKNRLKLIKDTTTERAFREAFEEGAKRYDRDYGQTPSGQAVTAVLRHITDRKTAEFEQAVVLQQIFATQLDVQALSRVVRRYAFAIEGKNIPIADVEVALHTLIADYLRPAFRVHPTFTERVGVSEIIGLLQDILTAVVEPYEDYDRLLADYKVMLVEQYRDITMRGISPKIRNRTIGISMEDVFIPLEATNDELARQPFNASDASWLDPAQIIDGVIEGLDTSTPEGILFLGAYNTLMRSKYVKQEVYQYLLKQKGFAKDIEDGKLYLDILQVAISAGQEELRKATITIPKLLSLPHVIVQGDPGSGKSTLTRYITWAVASRKAQFIDEQCLDRLPLRLRAIEFSEALEAGKVDSFDVYLSTQAGRFAPLAKHALITGTALILLDGLDEVGELPLRLKVKERVDEFAADPAFANNQLLITTRLIGYERSGVTGRFPHVTLTELNDEQIAAFVESWCRAIQNQMPGTINANVERQQLLDAIKGNPSIQRMARNPLLLTIIVLIKWQGRMLPDQRVLLYDAAAQTLIRSWPLTQRQVELDELFIREWLAPVAMEMFSNRSGDLIDEYSLMELLVASMSRLRSLTELDTRRASQELLENVTFHSGIILPRGTDADGRNLYGFIHQTFTEFLTAYHMAGIWEDGELDLSLYVHDPYWREVLLLMAGHLGIQRRTKTGKLVQTIRDLHSSRFEQILRRDLLAACRILADGVPVGPGELIESILQDLLQTWLHTPITPLREDIDPIFENLVNTEYGSVLIRIIARAELDDKQKLTLARQLGPSRFTDVLVRLLDNTSDELSLQAIELLAQGGTNSGLVALTACLTNSKELLRLKAAELLVEQGDHRAIDTLITLLDFENHRIRLEAAQVLAKSTNSRAIDVLVALIKDSKIVIQIRAAITLIDLDNTVGGAAIAKLLRDEKEDVRLLIARLLLERNDTRGVEVLANLLGSANKYVQSTAADILAKRNDSRGVVTLLELLNSADLKFWFSTAIHLLELQNPHGRDALARLMNIDRAELENYVREFGGTANELWEFIGSELLKQKDPRGIDALLRSGSLVSAAYLIQYGDQRGVEIAVSALESSDARIRLQAAEILAAHGDARGVVEAILLLEATEPEVRVRATGLLTLRTEPEVRMALNQRIEILLSDNVIPSKIVGVLPGVAGPNASTKRTSADYAYQYLKQYLTSKGELLTVEP